MTPRESERQTRKTRIDPKLRASRVDSWCPSPTPHPIGAALAIEEYETDLGPADYVLADQTELLGVVEARR